jgi:hypothetical protein
MKEELKLLIGLMDRSIFLKSGAIDWGSPIPSFGNLEIAKLATVGLNPSNREFVDIEGNELDGEFRRFHTLRSLGLTKWMEASDYHHTVILDFCFKYFERNPYDNWFKKLEYLISGANISYYSPSSTACHLDLIPYATFNKWTDLTSQSKSRLLELSRDFLGLLLNASQLDILVLNGQSVVDKLEEMANVRFEKIYMENWNLPRKSLPEVQGYSYQGVVEYLGEVRLKRPVRVLGYNHNIQSSFGVTKGVQSAIRDWITASV